MQKQRRWLQLGNLVPALTIIIALLGALGYPKELVALRDQLMLSVLGLLGIDALIERHGYHEKILGITSNLTSLEFKPRLYPRSTVHADERMPDLIRNSKSLLIAGPTLLSTVGQNLEAFREAAVGGKRIRLLLMPPDLDAKCMDWLANLYGMRGSDLKDHLNSSFTSIRNLYNSILPERRHFLEVRLLNTIPAASFVMQNSRTNDGLILYEVHLFGRSASDRPCLRLKPSETQMYSAYEGAIEDLWEASSSWSPDRFAAKD
jgi:hypothetical protein